MAEASIADAVRTLSATEAELERRIGGMSDEELGWTPGSEHWSPREVIGHLADAEMSYGFRLRKILAEDKPLYPAFAEEAWTEREGHARQDVKVLLDAWRGVRRWNLALIEGLSATDLARTGRHESAGPQTLGDVVRALAEHDRYHLGRLDQVAGLYRNRAQG